MRWFSLELAAGLGGPLEAPLLGWEPQSTSPLFFPPGLLEDWKETKDFQLTSLQRRVQGFWDFGACFPLSLCSGDVAGVPSTSK